MHLVRILMVPLLVATASVAVATDDGKLSPGKISRDVTGAMDKKADPCKDFYHYACGGWIRHAKLRRSEVKVSRRGQAWQANAKFIERTLRDAAAKPGADPDRRLLGDYYASCLGDKARDEAGGKPLEPLLNLVSTVEDAESLITVVARLHRWRIKALLNFEVEPDFKNPNVNIARVSQGGLGMPDRDYYVSEDEKQRAILADYEKHVVRMFSLLGDDQKTAATNAVDVVKFETELAKASRPAQEMRDNERLYHKIDIDGFSALTPGLPWKKFMTGIGYPDLRDINVSTPEFFERLEALVKETSTEALQNYLRWRVVDDLADELSRDFFYANSEFYDQRLQGATKRTRRWGQYACIEATNYALGEIVGRAFVKERFAGNSKTVATEMIGEIESAFETNLQDLSWMDDATRGRAKEKVATLIEKVGYPDEWRDYSRLRLKRGDHFGNSLASREFEFDHNTRKAGKPVNRNEWFMTPQENDAYYNGLWNEIVIPAGILQPPIFHEDYPASMNYGAIGAIIGHELTHGFDDQGRKFDPEGRLREWWAPEAAARFEARAQCVDDFYSDYEVAVGAKVNGRLTLGENIADIGGVKAAYQAFKLQEGRHAQPPPPIAKGLTDDQLFFVSFGQTWCSVATEEYDRLQVTTDPHSPAKFRVLGAIANNPDFARAFACEAESPMNPKNKCEVW